MSRDSRDSRKVLPEIHVDVEVDGSAEINVINGKGKSCTEATKELEAAIGADDSTRELKPEYKARHTETKIKNDQRSRR